MDVAIECRGVSKSFGGQRALVDVSLSIASGRVHSLVGQNGAGKSTLLGVLTGRITPERGQVLVDGRLLSFGDPRASKAAGIACIYQQLTMAKNLTAWENVFLGQLESKRGWLSAASMRARFVELCAAFDITIDPNTPTSRLSVAEQQMLEILRGLQSGARLILLDEPTAALPVTERDRLYEIVQSLQASGRTIVLVSHNLGEVLGHSDSVTVMRNGGIVESKPAASWSADSIVAGMSGGQARTVVTGRRANTNPITETPVLEVENLRFGDSPVVSSLKVRRGELLGVTGLVGSGRTSLLSALGGLKPESQGDLMINGEAARWPRTPRRALRLGLALVPEDRTSALVMDAPIWDNLGLGYTRDRRRRWVLSRKSRRSFAMELVAGFELDRQRLGEPIRNLSGGNQQKMLIAKWAGRGVSVLLADDPTQAVDVLGKADVLKLLRNLADQGTAVILASSDLDEVINTCDRALVMAHGVVAAQVERGGPDWTHSRLLQMSFGSATRGGLR